LVQCGIMWMGTGRTNIYLNMHLYQTLIFPVS
jgi:hypothetical protein